MLAVGLCYATTDETWEDARNFTKQILKSSTFGYGHHCYIKGVFNEVFSVWCEPGHLVYELPYSWNGYTIDTYNVDYMDVTGWVFYKK